MTAPLKTLIVGFGGIARGLATDQRMARWFPIATHAQALMADDRFQWVGVVDPDPQARQCAEADWQVAAFTDVADAAQLAPDVLVLATPPGSRADALRALPSVRAVFAEKPLGTADGTELIKLCSARAVPLQVNFWRRGDSTLNDLAAGGLVQQIGALQAGTGIYGNGLANNGSHLIDMIRMLVGTPQWVQAIGDAKPLSGGIVADDVQIAFALGMADGAVITVHPVDFSHYREVALDLWGTRGRLALQQETLDIRHMPRVTNRGLEGAYEIAADHSVPLTSTVADALPGLYANLHDAVTTGAPLLSPGSSALETEHIIDLIRTSALRGNARLAIDGQA